MIFYQNSFLSGYLERHSIIMSLLIYLSTSNSSFLRISFSFSFIIFISKFINSFSPSIRNSSKICVAFSCGKSYIKSVMNIDEKAAAIFSYVVSSRCLSTFGHFFFICFSISFNRPINLVVLSLNISLH